MGNKRVEDLYKLGVTATLKEPDSMGGGSAVVWLQKPGKPDMETVMRRAAARKAVVLLAKENRDDEEYLARLHDAMAFGDDPEHLVDFLMYQKRHDRYAVVAAEVAGRDEWTENNKIRSLQDIWVGVGDQPGLQLKHAEFPDDPDAARVLGELERFTVEVEEALDEQMDSVRAGLAAQSFEELRHLVVVAFIETRAADVWLEEFKKTRLFYAVRKHDPTIPTDDPSHHPEHRERYWSDRALVDEVDDAVLTQLDLAYGDMEVGHTEGKDLRATPDSSTSSEPPDAEATSPSSGPPPAET